MLALVLVWCCRDSFFLVLSAISLAYMPTVVIENSQDGVELAYSAYPVNKRD